MQGKFKFCFLEFSSQIFLISGSLTPQMQNPWLWRADYMWHTLFTQSSIDGHLGCLHLLATGHRADLDICNKYLFSFFVFWRLYPGVQLLGHMVLACLGFKETARPFPEWLYHFTFRPAMSEWSSFVYPGQHLVVSLYFILGILCSLFHCGFNLSFPRG